MKPTKELMQAVADYRAGKAEAFTPLYEASCKYIYVRIHDVMKGKENMQDAAGDIMQDTYLEISRSIGQLKDEETFLTWAGMIATRKCYAWIEKNKKYMLSDEDDNDTFENLADDDALIPEEIMQNQEKRRLVREIIETKLTPMQKICIVSYYFDDRKQAEIAKELGIPENTVKTNLSRAKAKMREGVLELERKQGTKLYGLAPLLLLLFKEDVEACVVPSGITAAVRAAAVVRGVATVAGAGTGSAASAAVAGSGSAATAVGTGAGGAASAAGTGVGSAATAAGAGTGSAVTVAGAEAEGAASTAKAGAGKTLTGKIAGAAVKTKITAAVAAAGAVAVVGGAVYMAVQETGEIWEKEFREYLLKSSRAVAFDLHDFEEDGIPELIVLNEDGSVSVRYSSDYGETPVVDYAPGEEVPDSDFSAEYVYHYGYDLEYDCLIRLEDMTLDCGGGEIRYAENCAYIQFENGDSGIKEAVMTGFVSKENFIRWSYDLVTEDERTELSEEEAKAYIAEAKSRFQEIAYTDITKETIRERFAEFKEKGNRERTGSGAGTCQAG